MWFRLEKALLQSLEGTTNSTCRDPCGAAFRQSEFDSPLPGRSDSTQDSSTGTQPTGTEDRTFVLSRQGKHVLSAVGVT